MFNRRRERLREIGLLVAQIHRLRGEVARVDAVAARRGASERDRRRLVNLEYAHEMLLLRLARLRAE